MGSINVGEVQVAALPPETRLVAGATGLRREVSWVATLRTRPPAFQSLKGGEFLLISTQALQLLDPQLTLARLLQSVARVEVAAAAVAGPVSDDAAEFADSAEIPLFALPVGTALPEVERAITRAIVEWQAELQRQSQEIYRHLTELAIEGRGLPAIAAGLAQATSRPVAYEDRTFALTLHGRPLATKVDDERLARAFRETQAQLAGWLRNRRVSASEPPCAEFVLNGLGITRLVAPVVLREGIVGYLSLLDEGAGFREIERVAIVRAAAACAIEMLRESAAAEAEDRVGATFLDDLLTGAAVSPEAVRRLASRLGYDLAVPQVVLLCQHHLQPDCEARPTWSSPAQPPLQVAVEQELSRRRLRALCRGWEDRVAILHPAPSGETPRAEVRELAAAIAATLGAPVSVGVGQPGRGAEAIPDAYRQAQGALSLGLRLFGPGRVTYYTDLGLYRLLLAIQDVPELRAFYDEALGKLVEHDRRGNGELLRTLEAYFAGRGSPTVAAERLHVHRNTLLYRLRRIQAITGLDLEDPETRLWLNLALHVAQVLGRQAPSPSAERGRG